MAESPRQSLPITGLLGLARTGDRQALDRVYELLYPELKRLARARLRRQGRGDSLDTTVVLHEAFLRFLSAKELALEDRRHFFAYSARVMRNVIVDSARELLSQRRGGGAIHETFDGDDAEGLPDLAAGAELVRVHDALLELESQNPTLAEVVEMRYFGGYSETEIAALQGVTTRTVNRRWEQARAWLYAALEP